MTSRKLRVRNCVTQIHRQSLVKSKFSNFTLHGLNNQITTGKNIMTNSFPSIWLEVKEAHKSQSHIAGFYLKDFTRLFRLTLFRELLRHMYMSLLFPISDL